MQCLEGLSLSLLPLVSVSVLLVFFLILIFNLFIYLAVPGLSCSMQDLHCSTWDL